MSRGNLVEVSTFSSANFGGYTMFEAQSITRSANTNAYAAGDVVMGADNSEFVFTKASQTGGWIVSVRITSDDTNAVGDFTIHFLSAQPTLFGDSDVFQLTADEFAESYMGSVTLTMGTIGVLIAAIDSDLRIPYGSDGNIYAVLVTDDGMATTESGSVWKISLGFENNVPSGQPNVR